MPAASPAGRSVGTHRAPSGEAPGAPPGHPFPPPLPLPRCGSQPPSTTRALFVLSLGGAVDEPYEQQRTHTRPAPSPPSRPLPGLCPRVMPPGRRLRPTCAGHPSEPIQADNSAALCTRRSTAPSSCQELWKWPRHEICAYRRSPLPATTPLGGERTRVVPPSRQELAPSQPLPTPHPPGHRPLVHSNTPTMMVNLNVMIRIPIS